MVIRQQRAAFAAYLRAQLDRPARSLPVELSEPQAGVITALLDELGHTYPDEDLGRLAGELAQALRDRLAS